MRIKSAGNATKSTMTAITRADAVTTPKWKLGLKSEKTKTKNARLKTIVVKMMALPA